ncbi:MAG: hypothetical protein ACI9QV_000065 [Methylophagaceae bacterium]|jgi:hypothetical protein
MRLEGFKRIEIRQPPCNEVLRRSLRLTKVIESKARDSDTGGEDHGALLETVY